MDYLVSKEIVNTKPEPAQERFEIKFLKETEGVDGKMVSVMVSVVDRKEALSLEEIDSRIANAQTNINSNIAEKEMWEAIKSEVKEL